MKHPSQRTIFGLQFNKGLKNYYSSSADKKLHITERTLRFLFPLSNLNSLSTVIPMSFTVLLSQILLLLKLINISS